MFLLRPPPSTIFSVLFAACRHSSIPPCEPSRATSPRPSHWVPWQTLLRSVSTFSQREFAIFSMIFARVINDNVKAAVSSSTCHVRESFTKGLGKRASATKEPGGRRRACAVDVTPPMTLDNFTPPAFHSSPYIAPTNSYFSQYVVFLRRDRC